MPILGIPPPSLGLGSGSPDQILPGSHTAMPPGLESIMEYSGLYMNDNSLIDTFKITAIGGLEDADLRDDREVNPQADGETAFDAWYGGRTITLTGYIRAFTIHKLRDMQQALKQAFGSLVEKPLVFHTWQDPSRTCWINCRKGAPVQMNEEQSTDNWFRRDFMVTLRASNPRFFGMLGHQQLIQFGVVDTFSADSMSSYDVPIGTAPSIGSGQLVPAGTGRVVMLRNDFDYDFVDEDIVFKYTPDSTFTSSQVRGASRYIDSDNFIFAGFGSTGAVQISKRDAGVESTLTPTSTYGTAPTRTSGTAYWVRVVTRGNTIGVSHYTTDPRIDSTTIQHSASYDLSGADSIKFNSPTTQYKHGILFNAGSTAWRFDDLSIVPFTLNANVATVNNKGNFPTQPQISFSGRIINPKLTNVLNGQSLIIDDEIIGTDAYVADTMEMTLKNSLGDNKFSSLSPFSDWPTLDPGDNSLTVEGSSLVPSFVGGNWTVPTLNLIYNDAWM